MLLKLSKFFTYVSLFCVLVVLTNAFFPFIGGKAYFFRIAIELATAFAVLWWGFEAGPGELKHKLKEIFRRPVVIAASLFVLAFLLAAVFADNPHGAFWSNYERGEGGFAMLHFYALFILLTLFFKEKADWERLFKMAVLAAGLMVLYGVFSAVIIQCPSTGQLWGKSCAPESFVNPFGLVTIYSGGVPVTATFLERLFSPQVRFQGSLGNPAYVAPYLMFAIWYCFFLASWRPKHKWWWIGTAVAFLIFAILTQTRGAFIGIVAAALFFLLYRLGKTEGRERLHTRIALWVFVALNWSLAYKAFGFRMLDIHAGKSLMDSASLWWFVRRLYDVGLSGELLKYIFVGSVASLMLLDLILTLRGKFRKIAAALILGVFLVGGGVYAKKHNVFAHLQGVDSFSTRLWTWGSAWKGFAERPLLGWGPENFPAVFDRHFDTRHFEPGKNTETWFDRAHSVIFDYLAETGFLGFVVYFMIFAVLFTQFFRERKTRARSAIEEALIVSLPVGYLVQGSALFDVFPIYLTLFIFLAFVSWWLSTSHPHHNLSQSS